MKKNWILLLFLGMLAPLTAQTNRFNTGIVGGLNFAEQEGESLVDYFGLNAGVIGTVQLGEQSQLGVELLYSKNGEYILPDFYPAIAYGKIALHHLEVPVHLDRWLIVQKNGKEYAWNLQGGVAYTRLLGVYVENAAKENVTQQIIYTDQDAWLLQAGLTYFFTPHLGFNLRTTFPLQQGLDMTLTVRGVYLLDG